MPWFVADGDTSRNSSNASCLDTCRLFRAFNRDVAKAKFLVKIAPNSPSGIPSSQWEWILKGEAVDLNQFFALLHHVVPDEERTGHLGDTEITFGVAEPKKKISTAAEWSSSWRRASKAISFAFPHRHEKLLKYGDYITNFSYTTLPSKMESQQVNKPYSSTSSSSAGSTQPLSYRMGLRLEEQNVNANLERNLDLRKATNWRSATISMLEPAKTLQPTANTDISVKPLENQTTKKRTAQMEASEVHGLHPKYLCHNLWDEGLSLSPVTAEWSEHAAPLPRLSQNSPTMVPEKLSQSILNYSKSKLLSMSMSSSLYWKIILTLSLSNLSVLVSKKDSGHEQILWVTLSLPRMMNHVQCLLMRSRLILFESSASKNGRRATFLSHLGLNFCLGCMRCLSMLCPNHTLRTCIL